MRFFRPNTVFYATATTRQDLTLNSVAVYISHSIVDAIGLTICLLYRDTILVSRNVFAHGKIITEDYRFYFPEVALMPSVRF